MSKLTITEAVKVIPVSESTLRRDLKSGKVSFDTDAKNRKQVDVSELTRVYGQLKQSNGTQSPENKTRRGGVAPPAHAEPVNDPHQTLSMNGNETHQNASVNGNDDPKIVALLENQIADLKAEIERASERENSLRENLKTAQSHLTAEQEKTRLLMLPASEAHTAPERKPNWVQRLLGIQTS